MNDAKALFCVGRIADGDLPGFHHWPQLPASAHATLFIEATDWLACC